MGETRKNRNVKIIAELCQNHNGDIDIMKDMVREASKAGATHAKIQTIFADELSFRERFEEGIKEEGVVKAIKRPYKPEYERLKGLELDEEGHSTFIKECAKYNIEPLTTVFTRIRIPFVKKLGFKEVKVASYDCGSFTMIKELRDNFEHLYISTGATFDEELHKTAKILRGSSYSFLHCVTIYPTPLNLLNLSRMKYLRNFSEEVGFSDHTLTMRDGIKASVAAIFFGADLIERHFTILNENQTKDGPVSINPEQLKELVEFSKMEREELESFVKKNIPEFKDMIGVGKSGLSEEELLNRDYYRGRFASKVKGKVIYNWEDTPVL